MIKAKFPVFLLVALIAATAPHSTLSDAIISIEAPSQTFKKRHYQQFHRSIQEGRNLRVNFNYVESTFKRIYIDESSERTGNLFLHDAKLKEFDSIGTSIIQNFLDSTFGDVFVEIRVAENGITGDQVDFSNEILLDILYDFRIEDQHQSIAISSSVTFGDNENCKEWGCLKTVTLDPMHMTVSPELGLRPQIEGYLARQLSQLF